MPDVPLAPWVAAHRLPARAPAGGGGLATSMEGLLADGGLGGWVGFQGDTCNRRNLVRVPLDDRQWCGYRDTWCHRILWPLCHGWFDPSRDSAAEDAIRQDFAGYREANEALARTLARHLPQASPWVQIHDYQLLLVPGLLRRLRPDCGIVFHMHVPVPEPGAWRWLPPDIRTAVRLGLSGADLIGVQTPGDIAPMRAILGAGPSRPGNGLPHVEAHPVPIDPDHLFRTSRLARARGTNAVPESTWPDRGGRILLVGRGDPSKNLPRSLEAVERLLLRRPDLRDRVSVLCLAPESRTESPAYRRCQAAIRERMAALGRVGGPGLSATLLEDDDRARALLALEEYDILLVAPLADGMNLVAKEGALLNRRGGIIVASTHMGAWEVLQPDCLDVHPLDTDGMARALERGLAMSPAERHARHEQMRCRMLREDPHRWLKGQLARAAAIRGGIRRAA